VNVDDLQISAAGRAKKGGQSEEERSFWKRRVVELDGGVPAGRNEGGMGQQ